eukprot:GFUD01139830.1.p1 GENE.GFUD01139830.1~~GFUD01139830.1.p1  ORF type:complete len:143 (+),score=20.80 GFUD01139830.1:48-431(+)
MDQSGTGKEVTVLQLLRLVKESPECSNCHSSDDLGCMDGEEVVGMNRFTVGMKLFSNGDLEGNYWDDYVGPQEWRKVVYTVLSVNKNNNSVNAMCVNKNNNTVDLRVGIFDPIVFENIPTFRYGCYS